MTSDTATPSYPADKVITLDVPLKRGEQLIDTLSLRRPNTGALRGVSITDILQMQVNAVSVVLPRITTPTLTEADVRRLDIADLTECAISLAGFFLKKSEREEASATE